MAQMFYDCTYFLNTEVDYDTLSKAIVSWIQHTSGLIVTFWTNYISFITYCVVIWKQSFDIFGSFKLASSIILVPSILFGFFEFYYDYTEDATGSLVVDWMYYNLRFASILANFILLGLIRNRVVHMRSIRYLFDLSTLRPLTLTLQSYSI